MRIFLWGFMGSGKSHWGKIWARINHLHFYDLDEEVERIEGSSVASIFEKKGEVYFRNQESVVLKKILQKNDFIMACGGGTPCFHGNVQWMNENGTTIFLSAKPEYLFNNLVKEKEKRPMLKDLKEDELLGWIEKKLVNRNHFYSAAKFVLKVSEVDENSLTHLIRNS